MNSIQINETIRPLLDEIQVIVDNFNFDEELNMLISANSFMMDDLPEDFYITVKFNDAKDTGTVCISTTDGVEFYTNKLLGIIGKENGIWVIK